MTNKTLSTLVAIQLLILSIYAVSVFDLTNNLNLLYTGNTRIVLTSTDGITPSQRDYFLDYLLQAGIHVSRHIYSDRSSTLNLYTSNIDIGNRLPTNSMDRITLGSNRLISAIRYLMFDFYERVDTTIYDIRAYPYAADGPYLIYTTDIVEINKILNMLYDNGIDAVVTEINNRSLIQIFIPIAFVFFMHFALLHIFIFACVFILLIQYAINQLKSSTILLIHGYSNLSLTKTIFLNSVKIFKLPFLLATIVFFVYGLFVIGYSPLYMMFLSLYFIFAVLLLICFYISIISFVIHICLYNINSNSILKGKKPFYYIQISNYMFRTFFMIFIIITFFQVLLNIELVHNRISMQADWDRTYHIYRFIPNFGNFHPDNLEREFEIFDDLVWLHEHLSQQYNSFIMDSTMFLSREIWGSIDNGNFLGPDIFTSIRVSPNYFRFNPIFSANNLPIENEIIIDDSVLNIIVPISLKPYKDIIWYEYLNLFYFNKVGVANIYNREFGLELNATSIDDLYVNIIFAKNNQIYFAPNARTRFEENINIVDPIVIIYTGSEHPSFLFSNFMTSYFLNTGADGSFDDLLSILDISGLARGHFQFESVYNENASFILRLSGEYIRHISLLILLTTMSFVITYILMRNFAEKNRYLLYLKMLLGFGFWKRNKVFIISMFVINTISVAILVIMFDIGIVPFLLCFYVIDFITYGLVERVIVNKPFSYVVKGEH